MILAALGTFLISVFISLVGWLAKFVTKKVAIYLAATGSIMALSAGFYAVGYGLISTLLSYTPSYVDQALSLVMPNNVGTCFSVIVSTRVARWVYVWNYQYIQMNAMT